MALVFDRQQDPSSSPSSSSATTPIVVPALIMGAPPSSSPALPPTPPSSDARSPPPPPPSPRSSQESKVPLSPPPSAPSPRTLPFSIENILRPDFGTANTTTRLPERPTIRTPELLLRTPPKTPEARNDTPVDLSQKSLSSRPPSSERRLSCSSSSSSSSSATQYGGNKYPENPEALANPKIPVEDTNNWPAWVYCTRYSDRPSSGPRSRRIKRRERTTQEKRPRTAFTSEQLARLKKEFEDNKYLTEKRRQDLAQELGLNESQIKIWFQNKRAKIKKSNGQKTGLAIHLMAQGLYNHSTVPVDEEDNYLC